MYGPILPEVEYERFPNPPIRAMLGQIHYPPILRLTKGVGEVADFQDAIREQFPGFAEEHQLRVLIAAGDPDATTTETQRAYRFTTGDAAWTALLTPTALTLEAVAGAEYTSYDRFSELFTMLLAASAATLRPAEIQQQGLRYVDHLEGDREPQQWTELINPQLLGAAAGDVLAPGLAQHMTEMLYPQTDGRLVFRHGMAPAGPNNALGYLLDFDRVNTVPLAISDTDAVMERFDDAHQLIYSFFRWCITDRAVEAFRNA